MFSLVKQNGTARRGVFETAHGTVQTPAFMNVATAAAIRGGVSALDLKTVGAPITPTLNSFTLHTPL